MATPNDSATGAALLHASSAETLASRRYARYAAQADVEGHDTIAALFRSIAARRARHATAHLAWLDTDTADQPADAAQPASRRGRTA